jgi:hypothetical protein
MDTCSGVHLLVRANIQLQCTACNTELRSEVHALDWLILYQLPWEQTELHTPSFCKQTFIIYKLLDGLMFFALWLQVYPWGWDCFTLNVNARTIQIRHNKLAFCIESQKFHKHMGYLYAGMVSSTANRLPSFGQSSPTLTSRTLWCWMTCGKTLSVHPWFAQYWSSVNSIVIRSDKVVMLVQRN